jgi:putative transposase
MNLIGALCVTPAQRKIKLHLQSYRQAISGDQVIRFLSHLLHHVKGPIVMVWDKHPIHRHRKVKDWLARHPRIRVYEFPTSAPELNPTEIVWTQLSESTASGVFGKFLNIVVKG